MLSNTQTAMHQLIIKRDGLLATKKLNAKEIVDVDKQICDIINPEAILKAKGKEYGEVTSEGDGAKFTVGSDKKVKWDSDLLMKIAGAMSWAQAVAMFKITFELSETNYKNLVNNVAAGLVDQSILDAVNAARTVEIGEVKLKKAELIKSDE